MPKPTEHAKAKARDRRRIKRRARRIAARSLKIYRKKLARKSLLATAKDAAENFIEHELSQLEIADVGRAIGLSREEIAELARLRRSEQIDAFQRRFKEMLTPERRRKLNDEAWRLRPSCSPKERLGARVDRELWRRKTLEDYASELAADLYEFRARTPLGGSYFVPGTAEYLSGAATCIQVANTARKLGMNERDIWHLLQLLNSRGREAYDLVRSRVGKNKANSFMRELSSPEFREQVNELLKATIEAYKKDAKLRIDYS